MQDVAGAPHEGPAIFEGPTSATMRVATLLLAHLATTLLAVGLSVRTDGYFLVLWIAAGIAFVLAAGASADPHHPDHRRLGVARAVHGLLLLVPVTLALRLW